MTVSAEECKAHFHSYLEAAAHEDVVITVDGRAVARLVKPPASFQDLQKGVSADPEALKTALREKFAQESE